MLAATEYRYTVPSWNPNFCFVHKEFPTTSYPGLGRWLYLRAGGRRFGREPEVVLRGHLRSLPRRYVTHEECSGDKVVVFIAPVGVVGSLSHLCYADAALTVPRRASMRLGTDIIFSLHTVGQQSTSTASHGKRGFDRCGNCTILFRSKRGELNCLRGSIRGVDGNTVSTP